jgi:hypothetical protein
MSGNSKVVKVRGEESDKGSEDGGGGGQGSHLRADAT